MSNAITFSVSLLCPGGTLCVVKVDLVILHGEQKKLLLGRGVIEEPAV